MRRKKLNTLIQLTTSGGDKMKVVCTAIGEGKSSDAAEDSAWRIVKKQLRTRYPTDHWQVRSLAYHNLD